MARLRSDVDGKAVTPAAQGLDGIQAAVRVELAPQAADEHLDHVAVAVGVFLVDVLGQLGLGDDFAGMHDKVIEHLVLVAGQLDFLVAAPYALGGEVDVPTLNGEVSVKIPSESQSGRVFRLRGKGVKPVRGGGTGDLFCRMVVETPVNLTNQQKEMLREFEASLRGSKVSHSPKERGWLDGVKSFFERLGSRE